jgi:polyisoprenoid-binding protein YceI
VLVALVNAAPAAAAEWHLDPAHSTITVEINQGGKPVTARFESFKGQIEFDPAHLSGSHAELTIDLASFRSGDAQRDQIATAGEFLAAASESAAHYRSTAFTAKGGDHYEVAAELTLKGVTKRLSHPATVSIAGKEAHARGEVVLQRLDFGVGAAQFPRGDQVGTTVTVRFDLAATRAG